MYHKETLIFPKFDFGCPRKVGFHMQIPAFCRVKDIVVAFDNRVLLVDDEAVVRFVTAEALRDHGFDVTEAASSDEALALFKEPDHFDVLFTDVKMPGKIDGVELASMIRHLNPDIPILIASGYALNVEPRIGEVSSPVIFVHKPYNLEKLVETVDMLVSQKRH